jgi:hypothetical protein
LLVRLSDNESWPASTEGLRFGSPELPGTRSSVDERDSDDALAKRRPQEYRWLRKLLPLAMIAIVAPK